MNLLLESSKLKEKILDIAYKHFIQFGFAKTTLTSIALAIGKKKSSLYYYFKDKEDLFASIVRIEADNLLSDLEKIFKKSDPEIELLKKYISERIKMMHVVSVRYSILKDELFLLLPEIERVRMPYHQKEVLLVQKLLERGVQKKVFSEMNTEHVAGILVNTLKGLEIPMYVKSEVKYDPKEIEGLSNLLIHGIV